MIYSSNYSSLQNAVNAAVSSNEVLVLDQDETITSKVVANLSANNGLVIEGRHHSVSGSFAGPVLEVILTTEVTAPLIIENVEISNPTGEGILFDGLSGMGSPINYGLVSGVFCEHGEVSDYLIKFRNFRHVNVRDCCGKASYGRTGGLHIEADGSFTGDINVLGSEFSGDGGRPLYILSKNGGSARGIHFTDSYIYEGGSVVEAVGSGSKVADIYFNGVQWDAFPSHGRGITFHVDAYGEMDNIGISNFYFQQGNSEAILVTGDGGPMTNILLKGGHIGGISSSATYAVNFWRSHDVTISDVQFGSIYATNACIGYNQGSDEGDVMIQGCSWLPSPESGTLAVNVHSARNGIICGNNFAGRAWNVSPGLFSRLVEANNLIA